MKERGILFSAPMVRALLAGTKTQTRRIAKSREGYGLYGLLRLKDGTATFDAVDDNRDFVETISCPYGLPGDRLWVRETARCIALSEQPPTNCGRIDIDYKAGGGMSRDYPLDRRLQWFPSRSRNADGSPRWQPAIHMPRWASRITLEITDVRVERLQDISEADAMAEGIEHSTLNDPRVEYRWLWESINGDGSWDANPWVWVVAFRVVENAAAPRAARQAT